MEQSFKLDIISRNNGEWQGTVTDSESGLTAPFKSVIELLKFINSELNIDR